MISISPVFSILIFLLGITGTVHFQSQPLRQHILSGLSVLSQIKDHADRPKTPNIAVKRWKANCAQLMCKGCVHWMTIQMGLTIMVDLQILSDFTGPCLWFAKPASCSLSMSHVSICGERSRFVRAAGQIIKSQARDVLLESVKSL